MTDRSTTDRSMMDNSLATARAILVGGAVFTMVVAAVLSQWVVAGILAVGVGAHTVHIVQVRRERERERIAAGTDAETSPARRGPPEG